MHRVFLCLVALVFLASASAQQKMPLRRAIGWQVVPERRVVDVGKPVVFILEVRNVSGAPIELHFSSGQQYDVLVYKQGEWGERWRWSKGKMFTMALTSIRLEFGQVQRFRVEWNQCDNEGRQVPPGNYRVEALLLLRAPHGQKEEVRATAQFTIRSPRRSASVRIGDLFASPMRWLGQRVAVEGRDQGWSPDPNCPMCAVGPPDTRSDWVLRDETGCIYITRYTLPVSLRGQQLIVEGFVKRNRKGQVYIEAMQVFPQP